jgi:cytochrome c biogenesis protein CcmG, thiol:disulfide interchange protein DsbE
MTNPTARDPIRILQVAAFASAALFAAIVVVVAFLATGDSDDGFDPPAFDPDEPAFGGTPIANLPGMPTPIPNTGPIGPNRAELGQPAPDFALADVRDPSTIRHLSDYSGTPMLLNWYASWCGPCRDEMPDFQAAYEALDGEFVFFAINFIESQSDALKLLDEFDITFPAVMDTTGAVSDHYRIGRGLPVSMLIDAEGIIRSIHRGPLFGPDLERELAAIGIDYTAD